MVDESFFARPKVVQIWVHEDDKLNVLIYPQSFQGEIFLRFTKCNQVMLFRLNFNPYIMLHADHPNTNTCLNTYIFIIYIYVYTYTYIQAHMYTPVEDQFIDAVSTKLVIGNQLIFRNAANHKPFNPNDCAQH